MQSKTWHSNQLFDGVLKVIDELIPGVRLQAKSTPSRRPSTGGFVKKGVAGSAGGTYSNSSFKFWFDLSESEVGIVEVSRPIIPLTKIEMRVLGRLPEAISGILVSSSSRALELAQRIAGSLSLDRVLMARFLRGGHASTYWTPALVLQLLQELTFRRYEGQRCTSGFVFSSQPSLYTPRVAETSFAFIKFPSVLKVSPLHFEKPASFRYVDGRNSFYFIDNWQRVHGILSCKAPGDYSLIDRGYHRHISPLVETMPGRVWCAYVGSNNDVHVHMSGGIHFHWAGNHWHLRDKSILTSIFEGHGCSTALIEPLASTIYTLSNLRQGAVLLITNDDSRLPSTVGVIDDSRLGAALRASFQNRSFSELVDTNSVLGLLASDGLTTISKAGTVLGCGDIIDIAPSGGLNVQGGGRTQAAIAASQFGLAIKISEDGPVSIFRNGARLIQL